MTLKTPDRNNIINYRRERAYSTLEEAKYNIQAKYWNLVANRMYYAVFYMCMALLLSNKINATTHAGVKSMMGLHFIKPQILSMEDGELLSLLFSMRQTGDYDDLFDWKEENILPVIPQVEALIKKIDGLIKLED